MSEHENATTLVPPVEEVTTVDDTTMDQVELNAPAEVANDTDTAQQVEQVSNNNTVDYNKLLEEVTADGAVVIKEEKKEEAKEEQSSEETETPLPNDAPSSSSSSSSAIEKEEIVTEDQELPPLPPRRSSLKNMLDVASEDDREALLNNKSNTIAHEPNAVLATTEHGMERKSTEDANAHDEDIEVETDANAKQASVVRTPSLIETTANAIMRFATSWQGTPETTEENSAIATPSDALSTNVDETSKPIANANIDTNTTTVSTSVPPIIEKELPANPENEQGLLEEEANTTTANNEDDDTNTEMKAASSTTHKASGFSTRGFGGKLKRISINAFTKMRSRDTSTSSSTGSSTDTKNKLDEKKTEKLDKMDQSTKNALNEAADQLNERGERLNRLEGDTEELAAGAANFAELAKQIAEREKNRKWYEF